MELAQLRIQVFAEYPYLYDGSLEYEQGYLRSLAEARNSIMVVAFDGDRVVGVSTGLPLNFEPMDVKGAWVQAGFPIDKIFYFSESVLLKEYRNQGIGEQFFSVREAWAKQQGYLTLVFCCVIRDEDDPRQPADYKPLDGFWRNRGFVPKVGFTATIPWKEVGENSETDKELQFWWKVAR